ncbi:MAG TPA: glycosyltransferase family 2 protein [Ferrovibrio sp.]|uniref:glycosyltransferase family 2 protein n=1 Tax=Ferrovibrio sp. TaxID=1917215 RepID=UPI002ED18395
MQPSPDISFVIPVFRKAAVLPYVIRALKDQVFDGTVEYIFVDDASPDHSLAMLRELGPGLGNCTVIENSINAGPSIRLNQGARAARGKFLCFIDADELIAPNAVAIMLRLLRAENAQIIHGKVMHSQAPADAIHPAPMPDKPEYFVSDTPLQMILRGRGFVRMTWLVDANVFRAGGGCDERIFVQDESFPLRMAAQASRMIDLRAIMTYAPQIGSHVSSNIGQLVHDRFLAHYNMLQDHPEYDATLRAFLTKKCISSGWKAVSRCGLPFNRLRMLMLYGVAKLGLLGEAQETLLHLAEAFRLLRNVRRIPGGRVVGVP